MPRLYPCTLPSSFFLFSLFLMHCVSQSLAQTTSVPQWRYRAIPLTLDPNARTTETRGEIVDSLIGLPLGKKIGSAESATLGFTVSTHPRSMDELPRDSDVVVVATFAAYEAHETPSGRSLYTIVQLKVQTLVTDKTGFVAIGQKLPILMLGSTALLPTGIRVSYGIPQSEDLIIPGHRYLAFLHYKPKGDLFELDKAWDLSTGKAAPNSDEDKDRVRNGISIVAGRDEQALIADVKSASRR